MIARKNSADMQLLVSSHEIADTLGPKSRQVARGSEEDVLAPRVGKVAAAGVVICAVLHVPVLLMHHSDAIALTLLMGVSAAACLSCVPHLLRGPTYRTWALCGLSSGAMLVLHLVLMLTTFTVADSAPNLPTSAHTANHGGFPTSVGNSHTAHMSGWDAGLFWAATALALIQVLLVATVVRRANRSIEGVR
jgi:hypothetical protein